MPVYQTAEDLAREAEVMAAVGAAWGVQYKKRHPERLDEVDFAIGRNGKLVGFVEVKTRTCAFGAYDDYQVDAQKIADLLWLAEFCGVPGFLVVRFADRLVWTLATQSMMKRLAVLRRVDRNDKRDTDVSVRIDWESFADAADVPPELQTKK